MGFDPSSLVPLIKQILSAPGTDLTTISAKRVRKQLLDLDPSLSPEDLKENKDEVDAHIARIFEDVSQGGIENGTDEAEDGGDSPAAEPPKKKTKKSKDELSSDAAYAKKLSNELNGRSRRTTTVKAKKTSNGTPKKGSRSAKSAAIIDSDEDSAEEGSGKKRKRAGGGGGAKGGFAKEYTLSEPLSAVINVDKLSRPQVVKQLWVYIKDNSLQNPSNKREIMCDDKLRTLFNTDKIDMFKMNKVLGQHLHEPEG